MISSKFVFDFQFSLAGKVDNRSSRAVCSKLTIKTPERRYWRQSGVFIVNFEHIYLVLVLLSLTLRKRMSAGEWNAQ